MGQRVKKSVPHMVDECDLRKRSVKVVGLPPAALQEDKSGEFAHHPADIVMAAITIQRFFRKIRENKEKGRKKKKAKRKNPDDNDSTDTESNSSSYDSSESEGQNESEDDSSSSETNSQVRKEPKDSSETESEDGEKPDVDDSDLEKAAGETQSTGENVNQSLEQSTVKITKAHSFGDVAKAAVIIQKAFRKYKAQTLSRETNTALKTQATFRGHKVIYIILEFLNFAY